MNNFSEAEFIATSLNKAVQAVFECKQGRIETNANYLTRFRNNMEVLKYYGGSFGYDPSLIANERRVQEVSVSTDCFKPGNTLYNLCKAK